MPGPRGARHRRDPWTTVHECWRSVFPLVILLIEMIHVLRARSGSRQPSQTLKPWTLPLTRTIGNAPTIAVGTTGLVAGNHASGVFDSASGAIGGGIIAQPSATSLGGGGAFKNGVSSQQAGHFTASYVVGASTTKAGGCISMGPLNQCLPPAPTATT